MNKSRLKLALLAGGASDEREVSLASSRNLFKGLIDAGYEIDIFDPALGLNQPSNQEDIFNKNSSLVSAENYIKFVASNTLDNYDLVVIGLHGKYGEDGGIQSLLDLKGKKYTGSGSMASSIAMDKNMSKIIFRHRGIKTANWIMVPKNYKNIEDLNSKIKNQIKYPCIVKPNDGGSTIGLTLCEDENYLEEAIILSNNHGNSTIIEEYIEGREMTVGIIAGEHTPVLEIIPKHKLYDYECKYSDNMAEYLVPAQIPNELALKLKETAIRVHEALGCKNYSRVDFRLKEDDSFYCFEANTLPGMTEHSLIPKMANAKGLSFSSLLEIIVLDAYNG